MKLHIWRTYYDEIDDNDPNGFNEGPRAGATSISLFLSGCLGP